VCCILWPKKHIIKNIVWPKRVPNGRGFCSSWPWTLGGTWHQVRQPKPATCDTHTQLTTVTVRLTVEGIYSTIRMLQIQLISAYVLWNWVLHTTAYSWPSSLKLKPLCQQTIHAYSPRYLCLLIVSVIYYENGMSCSRLWAQNPSEQKKNASSPWQVYCFFSEIVAFRSELIIVALAFFLSLP